ncbi:unnamed protein product [Rhizoctonia solani]|uniref:Fungal-type protein kinase domain-containing protein n=1 Tax=Rhizoctonia solani TaxID=456999 RepID=A0A8H3A0R6_9AGAM|nr:unnamed protein product [Rhizoctonia solani]
MSTTSPSLRSFHSPHHCVVINQKRKADSHSDSDSEPGPYSLTDTSKPKSSSQTPAVTADTETPVRTGSAQRAKESASNSRSISKSASGPKSTNNIPLTAPVSTQLQMGKYLEDELRGVIYCDPKFEENFLKVDNKRRILLDEGLRHCPSNFRAQLPIVSGERALYRPIVNVLNSIKAAIDRVRQDNDLGQIGRDFLDHHASGFYSEDPEMARIKPDLVMFEDSKAAWETLVMPIEVKAKHTYLKVGMKQLSRYARGIFAHQIHRRYVYGMVICQWAATFVRFDRSGILHSEPIDMRDQADRFRRAFAGLMMLDRDGLGYDTAFTTELGSDGQVEYYVDLPGEALYPVRQTEVETAPEVSTSHSSDSGTLPEQASATQQLPARRFRVMERLCHRKCIRGRATIVLRLREVRQRSPEEEGGRRSARLSEKRPKKAEWEEVPNARDYVLKMMWRNPDRRPEGEVLRRLSGGYGVVEYLWHSDKLKQGATCHEPSATTCTKCHDATPMRPEKQRKNLGDLDVTVPEDDKEEEPVYDEIDTSGYTEEPAANQTPCIYSWMLLLSVGRLLWTARNVRELLEAILDAILGYWHTLNLGILHRDISDGNVLIRVSDHEDKHGSQLVEEQGPMNIRDELSSLRLSDPATVTPSTTSLSESNAGEENHPMAKSRKALQLTLINLNLSKDSRGFISDYDLFTTHSKMGPELFDEPLKRGWTDELNWDLDTGCESTARPNPKKRKLNSNSNPPKLSGSMLEPGQQEEISQPNTATKNKTCKIDYRTGTPTFMSTRVLHIKQGKRYTHHFLDDLESFFWLLLWCVVEHRDTSPGNNGTTIDLTEEALDLLGSLDRADSQLKTIGDSKNSILTECRRGSFEDTLEECGNSWVTDPVIMDVISQLGTYFANVRDNRYPYPHYPPHIVFPTIVNALANSLEKIRLRTKLSFDQALCN